MKFITRLSFLIWFSIFAVGCNDKQEENLVINDSTYRNMIVELDKVSEAQSKGFYLTSNTEDEIELLKSEIVRAKLALLKLEKNDLDEDALYLLYDAAQKISTIKMFEKDENTTLDLLRKLNEIVAKVAKKQGVVLDDLDWNLYSYGFSQGLKDFKTFGRDKWDTRIARNIYSISVRTNYGSSAESWLLTPQFNLSKIDNPSFQIRHILTINKGNRDSGLFNHAKILDEAVNAYVSTDYDGGSPNDANWELIDISPKPSGEDFHKVLSPKISLQAFKGKKVTIAFKVSVDPKVLGESQIIWNIEDFDLFGSGSQSDLFNTDTSTPLVGETGNVSSIAKYSFEKDLAGMETITLEGNSEPWKFQEISGKQHAVSSSFNKEVEKIGTSLLYSPIINLDGYKSAEIQINHTIRYILNDYTPEEKTDYIKHQYENIVVAVASSNDIKSLDWKVVNFKEKLDGSKWDRFDSGWLALPNEVLGKKIRIGFRHQNRKGLVEGHVYYPTWQIEAAELRGSKSGSPSTTGTNRTGTSGTETTGTGATGTGTTGTGTSGTETTGTTAPDTVNYCTEKDQTARQGREVFTTLSIVEPERGFNIDEPLPRFHLDRFEGTEKNLMAWGSRSPEDQYIKISGYNRTESKIKYGEQRLVSDAIVLPKNKDFKIHLCQATIMLPEGADLNDSFRLEIAIDQEGVESKNLEWKTLKLVNIGNPYEPRKKIKIDSSSDILLENEFAGKPVRIGFWHHAKENNLPTMEVYSIELSQNKDEVLPPVTPEEIKLVTVPIIDDDKVAASAQNIADQNATSVWHVGKNERFINTGFSLIAKAETADQVGTQVLVTEVLDITNVANAKVSIMHFISGISANEKASDLVKIQYAIVDEANIDINSLVWTELPLVADDFVSTEEFINTDISLPQEAQGKKIRIGISHTTTEKSYTEWWINSINIESANAN